MFSVLMATYHAERPEYLAQSLESLAAQTLPADEIVLVKDGPLTDGLEDLLSRYDYLPIRTLLHQGDGQLGGALALGLEA